MKKTTTLACAALATIFASCASATEVVSSNIVGYQKLSIPANGYALLANPFTVVGSDGETFPINDMFADGMENATAGNNGAQGDNIQVWDSSRQGYTTYFLSARTTPAKLWSAGNNRVATTDSIVAGDGYWYLNRGSSAYNLTVSGEVATNDVTITLSPGYTLVCNPFPAALPLNSDSINWSEAGGTAGNNGALGDNIQVWDISRQGYTTYFLSGRTTPAGQWSSGNNRVATTDSIPAGAGFWYLNRGSSDITITLKSPLATTEE